MTVSYQYEVASSTSGGFTRLLFMWRGSLYKLIYRELALFLVLFGIISALYRHTLNPEQKHAFEQVVVYCDTFINLIPLSFVLGFYVAYVASRWWQQYMAIPWPDKVMHLVALYVIGNDEYGRMLRRALMRYLNLSLILVLRSISSAVKRRFPTLDHVVDAGFMTSLELDLFISVPSLEFNTYWIPCTWFINLLKEARTNHRLPDAQGLKIIMEEFNDFRSKCGMLWSYDWVSIPLVYTQVVTLATYSFFAVALVGRQYTEGVVKPFQMKVDVYFPVFTVLQFFFFMGLLKVAEQLINPFGDDDEDFELNWLIDRHTKVSYLGVDTLMNRCPPLVKDIYYDSENIILPYTEAAAAYKRQTYRGSVANMSVPEEKQTMFLPNITEEEEEGKASTNNPTPRTSSASLAQQNDSPPTGERRQGGSSPQSARRLARGSSQTVVTLDIQEEMESEPIAVQQQQQQALSSSLPSGEAQQQQQQQPGGKSNGRPSSSSLSDAVKLFSLRGKFTEPTVQQPGRRPFLALAKTARVSIQPWPSATNLKSEASSSWASSAAGAAAATAPAATEGHSNLPCSSISSNSAAVPGPVRMLPLSRSFNIPSIDVRTASLEQQDEAHPQQQQQQEQPSSPARKRKPARAQRKEEQSSRAEEVGEQQLVAAAVEGKRSRRARALRFNSFPKFLARRQRHVALQRASCGRRSSIGEPAIELGPPASKSSPELRIDLELETDAAAAAVEDHPATCCDSRRPSFFAGEDGETEEEEEEDERGKKPSSS